MWCTSLFIVVSVLANSSQRPGRDQIFQPSNGAQGFIKPNTEYSEIINSVLVGSKLLNPKKQQCLPYLNKDLYSITFDILINDTLSFTQTCRYTSAYSILSKFLKSPFLSTAASEIEPLLPVLVSNPNKTQNAFFIGQVLEYRIASMSPYVLKFKPTQEKKNETSDNSDNNSDDSNQNTDSNDNSTDSKNGEDQSKDNEDQSKDNSKDNDNKNRLLKTLTDSPYPIAIFHGLGDCCCFPGMMEFTRFLGKQVGSYTKCVEIGDGPASSWIMGFQKQVNSACFNIRQIPQFMNGVNLVGLSQGGLIARALSEMCNITVHNVITLGGPHMGVMAIPNCETGFYCDIFNGMLDLGVYDSFVQNNAGPAGYFKDPLLYNEYLSKSEFLAAANNEKSINSNYSNGFKAINQLVLIEFTEDTVVDPKISEQFGYFEIGSKSVIQNYNETDDYVKDVLGLKTLFQKGKVVFESIAGNHLQFNDTDIEQLVIPFLT